MPAAARTTPRRASGWSTSSARRSAGRDDDEPRAGRASTRSCRASRARRRSSCPSPCTYDLEVAATKYLDALPDGEVPLSVPLQRHGLLPRRRRAPAGRAGALERSAALPPAGRDVAADDRPATTPERLDPRCTRTRSGRLRSGAAERGLPTFDATVARAPGRRDE